MRSSSHCVHSRPEPPPASQRSKVMWTNANGFLRLSLCIDRHCRFINDSETFRQEEKDKKIHKKAAMARYEHWTRKTSEQALRVLKHQNRGQENTNYNTKPHFKFSCARYRKDLERQVEETKARRKHEDMNDTEFKLNSDLVKRLESDKQMVRHAAMTSPRPPLYHGCDCRVHEASCKRLA